MTMGIVLMVDDEIGFVGTKDQAEYIDSIIAGLSRQEYVFNYAKSDITIMQSSRVIENAKLLITVNSLPMHIGIARDVPTVAIIGGTPAKVVAPCDNPKFRYVENVDNINAITVDEVMEKVEELIG